jgi:hypothetical protein
LYAYVRNNPLRYLDESGRAVFESAEKLAAAGKAAMSRADLQPKPRVDADGNPVTRKDGTPIVDTFCNLGAQAILEAGSDSTLDGMSATKIDSFLKANATKLSPEDAVAYAKDGATVVESSSLTNHVAVVAPLDSVSASKSWKATAKEETMPMVMNVGLKNGVLKLSEAFRPGQHPQAYILKADKEKVDQTRDQRKKEKENK